MAARIAALPSRRSASVRLGTKCSDSTPIPTIGLVPDLIAELGEKSAAAPELIAVAKVRTPDLATWNPPGHAPVIVVFDRPTSPGNLGTLIRSANAFGAAAVVVSGHAADQFDPQCAGCSSTGSLFAIPVMRILDAAGMVAFRDRQRSLGVDLALVGTDESGPKAVYDHDFWAARSWSSATRRGG